MTTLFVLCAIAGVGLLVVGFVADGLVDGVFDALDFGDAGVLSVPVVGAFLAAFGIGGLLAASATDDAAVASLVGGVGAGAALGWVAHRLSRALQRMPTDATPTAGDLMGQLGRVVTPVAGGRGEVLLRLGGSPTKVAARSDHDIDLGDEVVVIEVLSASAVRVIPVSELLED